jgi:hypothetical protein
MPDIPRQSVIRKAWQTRRQQTPTGRLNLYIRFAEGFFDRLRPAYDAAADVIGELTEAEVSTLRGMIARYVKKCHARHGDENLQAAIRAGKHA